MLNIKFAKKIKTIWNNQIVAESDKTVVIENNHYFPKDSIKNKFLKESDTHTHCPWKGEASYFSINVDGEINKDAACYFPNTSHAAKAIEGYVAFWKGVEITE